ncbi:EpsG family protein [Thermotoga profunda]|uniref:EpsG family protein n=1 Tax=Thermotoga profunda TaxID=1508420 RepID=UPI001E589667|nr:EpsG family protein [Thermotoga profunda]
MDGFILFLLSALTFILLFLKPDTFDILNYTDAVGYVSYFTFEPLFSITLMVLRNFLSPRLTIWVVQFVILIISYLIVSITTKSAGENDIASIVKYFILVVLMPGFLLGFSNALRQCLAGLLMILSIQYLVRKKYSLSFLLFFLGIMFHFSLIFVVPLLFLAVILNKCQVRGIPYTRVNGITIRARFSIPFTFFLISIPYMLIFLIFPSTTSIFLSTDYGFYFNALFIEGRQPLYLKIIFVITSYVGSLVFAKFRFERFNVSKIDIHHENQEFLVLTNNLRLILLTVSVLFITDPLWWEAGSRVLYYYYVVEMFWMVKAFQMGYLYSPLWAFFVNTFAMNVWNILNG